MKRLISFVLVALMALSLTACTGVKKDSPVRVKCPACGYEFDIKQRSDPGYEN
jgi:hypothetical protein